MGLSSSPMKRSTHRRENSRKDCRMDARIGIHFWFLRTETYGPAHIMKDNSRAARSLFRPLRIPVFRNLLAANFVSDIGTFMQSVGTAWLMVSFGGGPMYVALTQTASSLPFFLLAVPAGAVGDIVDRR